MAFLDRSSFCGNWLIITMVRLGMNSNRYILIVSCLFAFSTAHATESLTYVDGNKPFTAINDVNRQAEAWAACAASYEVMSSLLLEAQPARSQQMKERSNGAKIAVTMTLVIDDLDSDISQVRFNALWEYAKLAGNEWPTTQRTAILVDAEEMGAEGAERFFEKVVATIDICISNLDAQQLYIDSMRELAKSGLLKLPEN